MRKKKSLSAALQETASAHVSSSKQKDLPAARSHGRVGKKAIAGFFDPAVSRQLRILGVQLDRTVQELLAEALNDLFGKYGLSRLA
jgi:hypothetical protein